MPIAELNSSASVRAGLITPEGFAKYGGVISSRHQLKSGPSQSANYGTAVKQFKVVPVTNNYHSCDSGIPAEAHINMFRCSPPEHLISVGPHGDDYYTLKVLERHPYSTQTFFPMGVSKDDAAYMAVVAETLPNGLPNLAKLEAFICTGDQAVTYGAGTWHAPMIALNQTVDFGVLIHENGQPSEDCQEVYIKPGMQISFTKNINSHM
jgi:ureidoglycolate lyase